MLYNYEIKYSDGSVERNAYSMSEKDAWSMVGKNINEHFLYGDQSVSIVSVRLVAVRK